MGTDLLEVYRDFNSVFLIQIHFSEIIHKMLETLLDTGPIFNQLLMNNVIMGRTCNKVHICRSYFYWCYRDVK